MSQTTCQLRVRYAETDGMGVVYYGNYLTWFEVGRTDLLRQLGQSYREIEENDMDPVCPWSRPIAATTNPPATTIWSTS